MKNIKVLITVVVILLLGAFSFYYTVFVMRTEVGREMITICMQGDQLVIRTAESIKYIEYVRTNQDGDTLTLRVYTTTVYNPFSDKMTQQTSGRGDTHYLKIENEVVAMDSLGACEAFVPAHQHTRLDPAL